MRLTEKVFVKVASSTENIALQNKTKQLGHDVYVVAGDDNTVPVYDDATLEDAFEIIPNNGITRGELPLESGAIYIAPKKDFASIGITVWTE